MVKIIKNSPATMMLLLIMIIVFGLETFNGGSTSTQTLMNFGANNRLAVAMEGQWYRLFTAIFVHIGFMHILMNSFTLFIFGMYLEKIIGSIRFTIIFIISGIIGNLISIVPESQNFVVHAGASTSIFGIFGAFVVVGILAKKQSYELEYLSKQVIALAVFNILFDVFNPEIDLLGHLGGFWGGLLIGLIIVKIPGIKNRKRELIILGGVLGLIATIWISLQGIFVGV